MSQFSWREEPISKQYDRLSFDCGNAELNQFLYRHARQSHEKRGAKTYLALDNANDKILGFYSLSPATVDYATTPKVLTKGLGKYCVPMFRLARLAVDKSAQGCGLGGHLFASATRRSYLVSEQVGGIGLLIDAKDESVAKWYEQYGAIQLIGSPLYLVLPFATAEKDILKNLKKKK